MSAQKEQSRCLSTWHKYLTLNLCSQKEKHKQISCSLVFQSLRIKQQSHLHGLTDFKIHKQYLGGGKKKKDSRVVSMADFLSSPRIFKLLFYNLNNIKYTKTKTKKEQEQRNGQLIKSSRNFIYLQLIALWATQNPEKDYWISASLKSCELITPSSSNWLVNTSQTMKIQLRLNSQLASEETTVETLHCH